MITVGEVLKKQRNKLEKTVEQVALDTKIQSRFIRYIEENSFEKFDSPIYAQGFIKIYAKYLNLNEDRVLAIYRRSMPKSLRYSNPGHETAYRMRKITVTPKSIAILLSAIFLLAIAAYVGYQIYQFQSPPKLSITSPEQGISVNDSKISVKGVSEKVTTVFVNDIPVELDKEGNFQYEVDLNPGVNLITVLAKKDNSTQESVETVRVTYVAQEEQTEEKQPQQKPNTVRLEIVNSSVWVQLNVDKENKISQIVQVGEEYEYEVKNEFSLTTGIIKSSKIYFNDQELKISSNSSNVGSLDCEIVDKNQISCQ